MNEPIKSNHHGVIDYVFSGAQVALPLILRMNGKARNTHMGVAGAFSILNALTATRAGVKPLIPLKWHQRADVAFLVGLGLVGFAKFIRGDKKALRFHLGLLATAVANYALTDYNHSASHSPS